MLKNSYSKYLIYLAAFSFLFSNSISCKALDNQSHKKASSITKQDQKNIKRVRQYFGKAGTKGHDYSAESTAGIGGSNKQGLKSSNTIKVKELKKNLYKDKKSLDKTIKEVTSNKK